MGAGEIIVAIASAIAGFIGMIMYFAKRKDDRIQKAVSELDDLERQYNEALAKGDDSFANLLLSRINRMRNK